MRKVIRMVGSLGTLISLMSTDKYQVAVVECISNMCTEEEYQQIIMNDINVAPTLSSLLLSKNTIIKVMLKFSVNFLMFFRKKLRLY